MERTSIESGLPGNVVLADYDTNDGAQNVSFGEPEPLSAAKEPLEASQKGWKTLSLVRGANGDTTALVTPRGDRGRPEVETEKLKERHKANKERHLTEPAGPWLRAVRVLVHFCAVGIFCVGRIWTRFTTPRGFYNVPDTVNGLQFIVTPARNFDVKKKGVMLPTDTCTMRLTHTCSADMDCALKHFNGYGVEHYEVVGETMVVHVSPLQVFPFIPENWYNRVWCDLTIAIPANFTISTEAAMIVMVVEDMKLEALSMTGSGGYEAQEISLFSKNLTINKDFVAKGRDVKLLLEHLSMPDSARMNLWTREGSIDITTESLPTVTINSANDAVCLVGEWSITENQGTVSQAQGQHIVGGNTANYSLSATVTPKTSKLSSGTPVWIINTMGALGSVGIMLLDSQVKVPPTAYSGAAFGDEGFFAVVDHTVVEGKDLGGK